MINHTKLDLGLKDYTNKMKEYSIIIDKIKESVKDQESKDFIDAFNYFYLYLNEKVRAITKEYKKFAKTLKEEYLTNVKLQNIISKLQKPLNSDKLKKTDLLNHKTLEIISEYTKNEILNFKHFAKINKYSANFNKISHPVVNQIEDYDELPNLVLNDLEKMNNEELVKNLER